MRVRKWKASRADGVGHAFLGEARLGGTGELLVGGSGAARRGRIRLALLHEAGESRTCELLFGGLALTRRGLCHRTWCCRRRGRWRLRKRASSETAQQYDEQRS